MKKDCSIPVKFLAIVVLLLMVTVANSTAQNSDDTSSIRKACLNYLEGFYEGDTNKLKASLSPSLLKFGYWKNSDTGKYESEGQMTYEEALDYAIDVKEEENFADENAIKKVQVLDTSNHIASAKVTAWWGIDYILLAKENEQWMIKHVLWEGPLEKEE